MTFFILGLPRSRTAWLANFMSYDGLFCHHEAIDGCETMDDYITKVDGYGDANTAISLFDFRHHFPDAKVVVIDTDISRCLIGDKPVDNILRNEKIALDAMDGLHVDFNDIDSRLREIWEYITDKPFDERRADLLVKMNIQVKSIDIDMDSMKLFVEANHVPAVTH